MTSSGIKTTGSLNGLLGIGMSSGAQGRLRVILYKKRSADTAMQMLLATS